MEGISPDTLNVLKKPASSLSDDHLGVLCQLVFSEAQDLKNAGSSTDKILSKHFDGADAAVIKQVHAAVLDFVLESAKTDLEPEDVASNLEEANVSDKVASKLVDGFREHKAAIRTRLQKIGHSFPQVTGMNWRLDYTLRSSSGGKVMLPTYVISLKTLDGLGREKTVQFTCNREQLKDFLRKVEDAETQVERAIGSTK